MPPAPAVPPLDPASPSVETGEQLSVNQQNTAAPSASHPGEAAFVEIMETDLSASAHASRSHGTITDGENWSRNFHLSRRLEIRRVIERAAGEVRGMESEL
jgi:hypothetical protein